MRKMLVGILSALLVGSAFAQTPSNKSDLLLITGDNNAVVAFKKGSFSLKNTTNGQVVATVIGEEHSMTSQAIIPGRYYVPVTDCSRGWGKIGKTSLDGKVMWIGDFSIGKDSVGSALAEAICGAYDKFRTVNQGADIVEKAAPESAAN